MEEPEGKNGRVRDEEREGMREEVDGMGFSLFMHGKAGWAGSCDCLGLAGLPAP